VCALLGSSAPYVEPLPNVILRNNVSMPRILMGMGLWCNDDVRCPIPARPCRPCYNDSVADRVLSLGLENGFAGVDTAKGYGNQVWFLFLATELVNPPFALCFPSRLEQVQRGCPII
jgi:hypothetical protein